MKIYHGKNNRRGVRDYAKKRYGNPLFRNKGNLTNRKRDYTAIKKIIFWLLLTVFVVFIGWFFLWSKTFKINTVEITGASTDTQIVIQDLIKDRLNSRRAVIFPQSSVFLFDTQALIKDIENKFFLTELDVKKGLPNELFVSVKEKELVAVFLANGEYLALDEAGYIIRQLTKRERLSLSDLPDGFVSIDSGELGAESIDVVEILEDESEIDISNNSNLTPVIINKVDNDISYMPGDEAVAKEMINMIIEADHSIADVIGTGVRWYSIESMSDTVDVVLREGWSIYLTTVISFDKQMERLSLVLKEKIGESRSVLEYLDLRFDEKIFFRFIENEQ